MPYTKYSIRFGLKKGPDKFVDQKLYPAKLMHRQKLVQYLSIDDLLSIYKDGNFLTVDDQRVEFTLLQMRTVETYLLENKIMPHEYDGMHSHIIRLMHTSTKVFHEHKFPIFGNMHKYFYYYESFGYKKVLDEPRKGRRLVVYERYYAYTLDSIEPKFQRRKILAQLLTEIEKQNLRFETGKVYATSYWAKKHRHRDEGLRYKFTLDKKGVLQFIIADAVEGEEYAL